MKALRCAVRDLISVILLLWSTQMVETLHDCLRAADVSGRPIPFNSRFGTESVYLPSGTQAIMTTYRFYCCGRIAAWQVYIQPEPNEHPDEQYCVHLQLWRPLPTVGSDGCYTFVGYDKYTGKIGDKGRVSKVLNPRHNLKFQPGDVIGMFIVRSNVSNGEGGILLDTSYTDEKVWFHTYSDKEPLAMDGHLCPLPVGANGKLNSHINAGPILSVTTASFPCSLNEKPTLPLHLPSPPPPIPALVPPSGLTSRMIQKRARADSPGKKKLKKALIASIIVLCSVAVLGALILLVCFATIRYKKWKQDKAAAERDDRPKRKYSILTNARSAPDLQEKESNYNLKKNIKKSSSHVPLLQDTSPRGSGENLMDRAEKGRISRFVGGGVSESRSSRIQQMISDIKPDDDEAEDEPLGPHGNSTTLLGHDLKKETSDPDPESGLSGLTYTLDSLEKKISRSSNKHHSKSALLDAPLVPDGEAEENRHLGTRSGRRRSMVPDPVPFQESMVPDPANVGMGVEPAESHAASERCLLPERHCLHKHHRDSFMPTAPLIPPPLLLPKDPSTSHPDVTKPTKKTPKTESSSTISKRSKEKDTAKRSKAESSSAVSKRSKGKDTLKVESAETPSKRSRDREAEIRPSPSTISKGKDKSKPEAPSSSSKKSKGKDKLKPEAPPSPSGSKRFSFFRRNSPSPSGTSNTKLTEKPSKKDASSSKSDKKSKSKDEKSKDKEKHKDKSKDKGKSGESSKDKHQSSSKDKHHSSSKDKHHSSSKDKHHSSKSGEVSAAPSGVSISRSGHRSKEAVSSKKSRERVHGESSKMEVPGSRSKHGTSRSSERMLGESSVSRMTMPPYPVGSASRERLPGESSSRTASRDMLRPEKQSSSHRHDQGDPRNPSSHRSSEDHPQVPVDFSNKQLPANMRPKWSATYMFSNAQPKR